MSVQAHKKLREIFEELTTPKVLVIEDDPDDAYIAEFTLNQAKIPCVIVGTAAAARDVLARKSFTVCLLDLRLPDVGNPLQLIEELKHFCPTMQIVVLTGSLEDEALKSALEDRVLAVLLKPIRVDQLRGITA